MSCCTDAGGLEAGLAKSVLLADRKVNLKGFHDFCLKAKARIWPWHICVRAARPWGGVRCGAGADCLSIKHQYFGLLMYEARKQGSRSQCSSKARLLPPTAGSSARAPSARYLSLSRSQSLALSLSLSLSLCVTLALSLSLSLNSLSEYQSLAGSLARALSARCLSLSISRSLSHTHTPIHTIISSSTSRCLGDRPSLPVPGAGLGSPRPAQGVAAAERRGNNFTGCNDFFLRILVYEGEVPTSPAQMRQ